jgi:hypothetical protein
MKCKHSDPVCDPCKWKKEERQRRVKENWIPSGPLMKGIQPVTYSNAIVFYEDYLRRK